MKIFIVCPGIGHIPRGFESFSVQLFTALLPHKNIETWLFQGAGPSSVRTRTLPILRREWRVTEMLGRLIGRDSYFVEQVSCSLALIPALLIHDPDIVFFSDGTIGNVLWRVRKIVGGRWKLLFSNGGPLVPPYPKCDHVHQVAPEYFAQGSKAGLGTGRQSLIPYGFYLPSSVSQQSAAQRAESRTKLGLPISGSVLVSVGAINSEHKRVDYLINEVAALGDAAPYLLLLGARDSASESLLERAADKLRPGSWSARTVQPEQVQTYLELADIFTLASLNEGFCRAIVEALAAGLPVLVHDSPVTRFVAGPVATYLDMSRVGALSAGLMTELRREVNYQEQQQRNQYMRERYSWECIGSEYVRMFELVVNQDRGRHI